jgi:hypothetical protein
MTSRDVNGSILRHSLVAMCSCSSKIFSFFSHHRRTINSIEQMTIGKALSLLLVYTLVVATEAFSPAGKPFATTRLVARNAVALLQADTEDHAAYLMHKAEECAFSDTCTVDDAKSFLREVLHVQSGCAAGTLLGHELCEDQAHVADIVSHLRAKVEQGGSSSLR